MLPSFRKSILSVEVFGSETIREPDKAGGS